MLSKGDKEYLNQRGTKSEFFECTFGPLSSHPFSLISPPFFPLQALFTLPPLLPSTPPPRSPLFQKNPRVRKIRVRNSGAGNGCANFMDTWKNALFLQEKPMSIKFLVLGGGGILGFGGGGVPILFLWARGFF